MIARDPRPPREPLGSWIPFSERKKIADQAVAYLLKYCGKPDDPTNIVTALDALGYLRRKPDEPAQS